MDEIRRTATSEKADIICIQEPHIMVVSPPELARLVPKSQVDPSEKAPAAKPKRSRRDRERGKNSAGEPASDGQAVAAREVRGGIFSLSSFSQMFSESAGVLLKKLR